MHDLESIIEDGCRKLGTALVDGPPRIAMILGSGLGHLADLVDHAVRFPASDIPGYPASTVLGHEGTFVVGRLAGVPSIVLKGRIHGYEGHSWAEVALPVRIFARLGVRILILTNAAGGIQRDFRAGDLMLMTDHLNLTGRSPLTGPNMSSFGPRFPDQSHVYPSPLRTHLREVALELGHDIRSGVYACLPGPEYETPAEIRMLRILGADAVGMSTVPEAIAAAHAGLPVLGVSLISNLAAGLSKTPLSHAEVLAAAALSGQVLGRILTRALPNLERSLWPSAQP